MANKHLGKKIALLVLAGSFLINAYAVGKGFYMGLMTGPASNDGGDQTVQGINGVSAVASPKSKQWGSGAYMGYKMNQYASVEGGLHYFSGIHYSAKPDNVQTCSSLSVRNRDLYLAGKGEYDFINGVSIFGKGGVAVVYQTVSGAFQGGANGACGDSQYSNKFSPMFGLGVGYDLSQSWVADFSWTRIAAGGPANNIDFFAGAITYHFTDRYCGQFLCDS